MAGEEVEQRSADTRELAAVRRKGEDSERNAKFLASLSTGAGGGSGSREGLGPEAQAALSEFLQEQQTEVERMRAEAERALERARVMQREAEKLRAMLEAEREMALKVEAERERERERERENQLQRMQELRTMAEKDRQRAKREEQSDWEREIEQERAAKAAGERVKRMEEKERKKEEEARQQEEDERRREEEAREREQEWQRAQHERVVMTHEDARSRAVAEATEAVRVIRNRFLREREATARELASVEHLPERLALALGAVPVSVWPGGRGRGAEAAGRDQGGDSTAEGVEGPEATAASAGQEGKTGEEQELVKRQASAFGTDSSSAASMVDAALGSISTRLLRPTSLDDVETIRVVAESVLDRLVASHEVYLFAKAEDAPPESIRAARAVFLSERRAHQWVVQAMRQGDALRRGDTATVAALVTLEAEGSSGGTFLTEAADGPMYGGAPGRGPWPGGKGGRRHGGRGAPAQSGRLAALDEVPWGQHVSMDALYKENRFLLAQARQLDDSLQETEFQLRKTLDTLRNEREDAADADALAEELEEVGAGARSGVG